MTILMMTKPIRALRAALTCVCALSSVAVAQSVPIKTASLVWESDGSDSGSPFADLRDYVMLRDGTVWALDFKDQVVRRWDANGKSLPTIGRKGSGPGEFRNSNGMAVAPDGNVWFNDQANGRFVVFGANGTALRAVTIPIRGYAYRWEGWFDPNGELIEREIAAQLSFRRIGANGAILGKLAPPNCPSGAPPLSSFKAEGPGPNNMFGAYPFSMGGGVVADRRGHFWCAAQRATRAARMAYGKSDTVARTAVELPPLPVSAAERDAAIADVEKRIAKYETNDFDKSKVPTARPGIASMNVDADGRLWITHAGPSKVASSTWTVFDASGKALFRLTLPVRTNPYLPVVAKGNDLVVSTVDSDDVVSIARYRLK